MILEHLTESRSSHLKLKKQVETVETERPSKDSVNQRSKQVSHGHSGGAHLSSDNSYKLYKSGFDGGGQDESYCWKRENKNSCLQFGLVRATAGMWEKVLWSDETPAELPGPKY